MKLTQRKTFICLFAMLLAIAIGLSLTTVKVSADSVSASDYFDSNGSTVYEDDKLVVSLEKDTETKFKRELVLNDFAIKLSTDKAVDFTVTYDSAIATGNKVTNGDEVTYETEVTKKVSVNGEKEIKISVTDGKLVIDGVQYTDAKIFGGYAVGKIGFVASETAKVFIEYIDQKSTDTDGAYKQTFVLDNGAPAKAKTVVLLSKNLYNGVDSDVAKVKGQKLAVSFTEYAVISSGKSSSSFKAAKVDDAATGVYVWEGGKYVSVETVNTVETVNIISGDDTFGSFTIKGVEADNTAPAYVNGVNEDVIASFKAALEEATYEDYDGQRFHIRIGSSKYLTIPSMENFVSDDYSSYSEMSYTVWYCNNNSDWTSYSGLKVPVASEGVYKFFVLFKDKIGNAMEKSDFLDDDNNVKPEKANLVFEFEIINDAPLSIKSATQENAYKGIAYTAASFTISAKDYTVEYTLAYSADGESNWEEIIPVSELEEGTSDYKKYASYNYDGSLTFTPAKLGYYKIEATIYENGTFRTAEDSTTIQATKTPVKVVPNESNWLYNNVWSLVFLSIGTLSLIGLIVVLCIKPKED